MPPTTWRSIGGSSVEAVHGGGRRPGGPARLADVEQQRPQVTEGPTGTGEREGVGTDLFEEAALDSAAKLVVGQPLTVRLGTGEGPQLTGRDRREATAVEGHAANPSRRVSQ
jgi:hypothetical protein